MTDFMSFVDKGEFTELFEELGWDQAPRSLKPVSVKSITIDRGDEPEVTAEPVASQDGLTVWVVRSTSLPSVALQRSVDDRVRQFSAVRLVIFTDGTHQSWRWPRSGATAATNRRLLHHHYTVGDPEQHADLARRLAMIELQFGERIGITEIQARMAKAFNDEAVRRSQQASGHMKRMKQQLLNSNVANDDASSLLVRLLFLFFGDDTRMWPDNTFQNWVLRHTTGANIHAKLTELFGALCDPELDDCLVAPGEKPKGKYAGTEFEDFRRIDGMYRDRIELPHLNESFRQQVMEAGDFDWAKVNPDIFGAMFQELVESEDLRGKGEHYTSEENIQKVIDPLFLDEYRQRFENAYEDCDELLAIRDELASLQFLDPACGCGNFLIQAYKHLRGLEFEILTRANELETAELEECIALHDSKQKKVKDINSVRRRYAELTSASIEFGDDVLRSSKLSMRQFFGIEINPWPAKVASTAMLLVDHLCNQAWGENVVRLPIEETAEIICANALRLDWNEVISDASRTLYVFGNPPFIGYDQRSPQQLEDLQTLWKTDKVGRLDYVTAWYAKCISHFAQPNRRGEFSFVSTNSITQGEPVRLLFVPIFQSGWSIKFAWRSFVWEANADESAAVHCVIIGFSKYPPAKSKLWGSTGGASAIDKPELCESINPYLVPGQKIVVIPRSKPLSPSLPPVRNGNVAGDTSKKKKNLGGLVMSQEEKDSIVSADPRIERYIRPFIGGQDFLRGKVRWTLWLRDSDPEEFTKIPEVRRRLENVKEVRNSSTEDSTVALSQTPHLFKHYAQPTENYICIPRTVTERRRYFVAGHVSPENIVSNGSFWAEDPTGLVFAMISSSSFMSWQNTVGGRLKSDPRFANRVVWNTFPIPELSNTFKALIISAGQGILDARALHPERSLAEAYDPKKMDPELVKAHDALDLVVDKAFGADHPLTSERERLEILFARYEEMTESQK